MGATFEGRFSDSPYIEMVWHGWIEGEYRPICPADVRWNLLFIKRNKTIKVTVEGPTTKSVPKNQSGESEFLVIKFKLGTFMPSFMPGDYRDGDVLLPEAGGKSFWLDSAAWQLPDYDNVETFVDRLVHEGLLIQEPVINGVLQDEPQWMSSRTVRRRFLLATGLTQGAIRQIERANYAASLLAQNIPILDVVDRAGYADQPHLTRSLRRYYGQTPTQITQVPLPE